MRVFLTGATGFIGEALVRELRTAGHEVLGLARSDDAAGKLARLGIEAHRGDLADTASLAAGARACDGVIHTAFIHDFSAYAAAAETDRRAVEALVDALEGSGKPFVLTSGSALLAPGRIGTEEDAPAPGSAASLRAGAEMVALGAASRGVRSSVVRLPPTVHGIGDHGFVPALVEVARRTGVSAFIGEGANRWPAVHRLDAARLYRLALERSRAGIAATWCGRRRRDFASDRGGDQRGAWRSDAESHRGAGTQAFRLAGGLRRDRQSNLQWSYARGVGVDPEGIGTADGYEGKWIFPETVKALKNGLA